MKVFAFIVLDDNPDRLDNVVKLTTDFIKTLSPRAAKNMFLWLSKTYHPLEADRLEKRKSIYIPVNK